MLRNFYLSGSTGYWLCMLILNENLLWCMIAASKTNLIFLTIERYLKVVYPVWSRNKLQNWMIYSVIAFAWIGGFVHVNAFAFATSVVINGVCYFYVTWVGPLGHMVYVIFYFAVYYVSILIISIFCYWRILIVIRRQAQVMAGYGTAGPSASQVQADHIQSNVIKTMILVTAFYAVSDLPINVNILAINIFGTFSILKGSYHSTLFVSFFYFCANPFIYAIKFDPVKRVLLRLIPCKTALQPTDTVDIQLSARN